MSSLERYLQLNWESWCNNYIKNCYDNNQSRSISYIGTVLKNTELLVKFYDINAYFLKKEGKITDK